VAVIAARPGEGRNRAAGRIRWLGAFSLMLLVVAVLAHRRGVLETPGFMTVFVLDAGVALLALGCAAAAFARLWNRGGPGGGDLTVGALAAMLALLPALAASVLAWVHPALVDVATDPENPPAFAVGRVERGAGANPFAVIGPDQAARQAAAYPALAGRRYDMDFADGVDMARQGVARSGWSPLSQIDRPGETTLGALARSAVFAMPADVAVRVIDEGGTVFVDMRSAWRYGRHDFGDNAARIEAFYRTLDAIAAATAAAPLR
jgi:hypothetical protein